MGEGLPARPWNVLPSRDFPRTVGSDLEVLTHYALAKSLPPNPTTISPSQ